MRKMDYPIRAAARLVTAGLVAGLLPFVVASSVGVVAGAAAPGSGAPTTPPAQICGNASILRGPSTQPAGSVRVDPGQNLNDVTQANPGGTTFWLAPGTYTLGTSPYGQVIPKDNDTYIGAPGSIIDGQNVNRAAFTQGASGVTIMYLTVQNFGAAGGNNNEGVVNHDGGSGWQIKNNTIQGDAGAGVFIGSDNVVSYNCLLNNGQYGFSMYKSSAGSLKTITIDHNEIAGNNTYDWEAKIAGCGCTGGGKFWDAHDVRVTNNWVHDNKSVGLWADTNNYGFVIDGNYIANNDSEGIFYEVSYNAQITNNTLTRNAIVKGQAFAARNDNFPVSAIYISESGGDPRVNGGLLSTLDIYGNNLVDNWGGVTLWENADRFCGSPANTSGSYCTLVNPATVNLSSCNSSNINKAPYYADCRYKTQNVSVHDNQLTFHRANVGCTTSGCGQQALISNYGTYPSWSPYTGRTVQDAISYRQNNHFTNNSYIGDWVFTPYETGPQGTFATWQSAPSSQDAGSTFNSSATPTPSTTTVPPAPTTTTVPPAPTTTTVPPAPTTTTTVPPAPTTTTVPPAPTTTTMVPPAPTTTTTVPSSSNLLDPDTAGMEGSIGHWASWYSTVVSQSNGPNHTGAHSLRVDVTAPWGWGVQLNVWPGLPATAGKKTVGFWGLTPLGVGLNINLRVIWLNGSGEPLQTDVVSLALLTPIWQQSSRTVTAPAGTAMVSLQIDGSTIVGGQSIYLDDFSLASS